jgi:hypothetical protein
LLDIIAKFICEIRLLGTVIGKFLLFTPYKRWCIMMIRICRLDKSYEIEQLPLEQRISRTILFILV